MRFTVEHLGLAARNPDALASWYVNILGAERVFSTADRPAAHFVRVGGGLILEIYSAAEVNAATANNRLAGWRHLALQVGSIEDAKATLERRGVVFQDPVRPAGGGGRVLFFADPEGHLLHLVERPAGSIFLTAGES